MKLKTHSTRLLAAMAIQLAAFSSAYATDFAAGFDMDLFGTHDNNIRLTQSDKTAISGIVAAPAINVSAETETAKVALDSKFSFSRYDDSGFNSDDQTINFSSSMQLERGQIGLNAGLLRDSTTTSELLGSGRIGTKAERSEQYSIAPFGILKINEKNSLTLRSSYLTRNYQGQSYIGYNDWNNSLDWGYQFNERWAFDIVALHERYRSDSISLNVPNSDIFIDLLGTITKIPLGALGQQSYSAETTTKGGQVGASYELSESTSLRALLGRSNSKTNYEISDSDYYCTNGFRRGLAPLCGLSSSTAVITTAAINWKWESETQQVQLNLTKSQQPTSNGYAIAATILQLNWDYHLTELDRLSVSATGTQNRQIGSNTNQQNLNQASQANRDYRTATLGYHRQLSENWYLDASYQYRYQEFRDFDYRANSNVISLGVSYHPVSKHWSR